MRRSILVAALCAALCPAACSADKPAATPAPSATPPSPAAPRAQDDYDGGQRLAGALSLTGISCVNWAPVDTPIGAQERGSCYVGTEEVGIGIYDDHDQAAADPQNKAALLSGSSDVNEVVGGNWTLSCDSEDLCDQIAQQFGGTVNHIPK